MKTAFMFSGQGAEKVGMGQDLFNVYEEVRTKFTEAIETLGFDLAEICFKDGEALKDTEFAQPALVMVSMAIVELLEKEGIKPDYVLGLSLGEYSAFVASGALDYKETLELVNRRGQIMKEAFDGLDCGMTAVLNASLEDIKEVVEHGSTVGVLEIANYNTSKQIVISGEKVALAKAHEEFTNRKIKFIPLGVSGAFHTSLLEEASQKLRAEIESREIKELKIPVVTNVDGIVITDKDKIVDNLTNHLKSSVMFEQSIKTLIDEGVTRFVEIGTGKTLASFVKKIDKTVEVLHIEDVETFKKAVEIMK